MATALDKSLDDVSFSVFCVFPTRCSDGQPGCQQIISSRPRTGRRRPHRGPRATNGVTKMGGAVGAARARYADVVPTANGNRALAVAPFPAAQPDATKIIVSNLPTDVNEAQIRVSASTAVVIKYPMTHHPAVHRNCLFRLSDLFVKLTFITTLKETRRDLHPQHSPAKGTETRLLPNITID